MPQPIDFQTEVARTHAVERIQTATDRSALAAQQRLAAEVDDQVANNQSQVLESPEAQSEHIDSEEKRRNPYARRKHAKGQRDENAEDQGRTPLVDGEGQRLDVSI